VNEYESVADDAQSSNSHSVAADCNSNRIFVPQVAPVSVVGVGGDTTTVGAGICGPRLGRFCCCTHFISRLHRRGQHSIRINDQWRICFIWTEEGPADVEIVDYH
jgi:hypothetical protein